MTRPYHIFALLALVILTVPQAAAAFVVHEQSAIALDEQTALYSIRYSAQFGDRDAYYPRTGDNSAVDYEEDPGVQFTVLKDGEVITPTFDRGIVVSSAAVVNGEYFVPEDDDEMQTLFVVVTTDESEPVTDLQVRLHEIPVRTVIPNVSASLFRLKGPVVEDSLTPKPKLFGS